MNLVNLYPEFTNSPFLTKPIERSLVESLPFKDFDNNDIRNAEASGE